MKNQASIPYKALCTEFYELDKPFAPNDALDCYLKYAKQADGPILEPMCGTGRFLIPFLERGYFISGFDSSNYMLDICRKKSQALGLNPVITEANFETFTSQQKYQLIFIPNGSFCLLTDQKQVLQALKFISKHLESKGKFVFEIVTTAAVSQFQGYWKGKYVNRKDGSKIVLNTLNHFDELSRIETTLCRYELWENNQITQTEVEDFKLRLYEIAEIEQLLDKENFQILGKWQAEPYTGIKADSTLPVILYECIPKQIQN